MGIKCPKHAVGIVFNTTQYSGSIIPVQPSQRWIAARKAVSCGEAVRLDSVTMCNPIMTTKKNTYAEQ